MSAPSVTGIANSAIQRTGAGGRIMSLSDNSREARACNVSYDSNRLSELSQYDWNFARKRALLAPDSTGPSFEYKYQFTLPADCVRVRLPQDYSLDWRVEGRKILTNWPTSPQQLGFGTDINATGPVLGITYTADVSDPSIFDPVFYDLLSLCLAIDICEELTQSTAKKESLIRECNALRASARLAASIETLPAEGPLDSFLLAWY